ncbi:hypothetical protein [Spirochaeta dissipatitropha]
MKNVFKGLSAAAFISAVFLMVASCGLFPSSVPQIDVFRVLNGNTWVSAGESLEIGIGVELKNFAVNAKIAREDGSSASDTGGVIQVWVEGESTHRFSQRFDGTIEEVINRQQGVSFTEEGTYKLFGRVVADNGSEVDSKAITVTVLAPLMSDLIFETTTNLPSNGFAGNSLKWTLNSDHDDADKVSGFKIGFKREGRAAFAGFGLSHGEPATWEIIRESNSLLSRSGNEYSLNVNLAETYADDDNVYWQTDNRSISYKVIAVDAEGDEIMTIYGQKKLQLFDRIRVVEARRDGTSMILRFTGSSLATHFELEVNLHANTGYTYVFNATGNNKLVRARSDFDSIRESDWQNKPSSKTSYMYQIILNNVPVSDNWNDRSTFRVTPGKSASDLYSTGSNSALAR